MSLLTNFLCVLIVRNLILKISEYNPKIKQTLAFRLLSDYSVIDKIFRVTYHLSLWLTGYYQSSIMANTSFGLSLTSGFQQGIQGFSTGTMVPLRRTMKFTKAPKAIKNLKNAFQKEIKWMPENLNDSLVLIEILLSQIGYLSLLILYLSDNYRFFYEIGILGTEEMSQFMRTIVKNCWLVFCIHNCLVTIIKMIKLIVKNGREINRQQMKFLVMDIVYNLVEIYVNVLFRTPVSPQEKMINGGLLAMSGGYRLIRMIMT